MKKIVIRLVMVTLVLAAGAAPQVLQTAYFSGPGDPPLCYPGAPCS